MQDTSFSVYCGIHSQPYGRICELSDLVVVKTLSEELDPDGVCRSKEVIYRCRVCGGFYRQKYSATFYEDGWMGDEDGWVIDDNHYKIEEPAYHGSLKSGIPFTLEDARSYGYTGEDFTWKDGRCNFPLLKLELTCRANDLYFVAFRSPEKTAYQDDRIFKCGRCGQIYLRLNSNGLYDVYFKPASERFSLEEARRYGYDSSK